MSKHERETLVETLSQLKPALRSGSSVPELHHFWCDGKRAFAYDGGLGIMASLPTEFKGGVPGTPLLGLLGGSPVKEVTFNGPDKGSSLTVSLGKAKAKLPLLPFDRQPWPFPDKVPTDAAQIEVTDALLAATSRVLVVKADEPIRAEHHGVIFYPAKKGVFLFTTDEVVIARAYVSGIQLPGGKPLLVSRRFLEQVARLCNSGTQLLILKDCMLSDDAELQIGTHMLEAEDEVLDLDAVVAPYVKGEKPVPLPVEPLTEALKRLMVLVTKGETPLVKLTCAEGVMRVQGRFSLGEYSEELTLEKPIDGEVIARADLLLKLLAHVDNFSIAEDGALVLRGDNLLFVVSGAEGE